MHTGSAGSLLHVRGGNGPGRTSLGGEHPDHAVAVEVGLRVHQDVSQVVDVTVVIAPPHDRGVGYVLIVLIDQLGTGQRLGGRAELVVDVVVVTELLDDEAGGEAKGPTCCARHCRLSVPRARSASRSRAR